ncbi:MAG: dihydroorotate dehydrogenase [Candidatus Omnitrophica bacterium]|nr:dihydroorotate dehydrogenase [Candidatus Omnitrophota bacterium]
MSNVDLSVQVGPLKLKNPVMVASGTASYGEEQSRVFPLNRLGAFVTKSITLKPRQGNPPYRVLETPSGMLNSIGLQNVGVDEFLRKKLPFLRKEKVPVIVNIAAKRIEDYATLTARLSGAKGISGFELNVSCPNVKEGGLEFGTNPKCITEIVRRVRRETRLPVITKLSPNVTNIVTMAKAAMEGGSDAVSLVNTFLAMAVDVQRRRPVLSTVTGGLSGPAIKPIALRMIWQVYRALKCPIVGIGGIMNAEDAIEMMMVGSSAIQVGTANFVNPKAPLEILGGLQAYAKRERLQRLSDIVGVVA